MPLFYQEHPREDIRFAIWHITEQEDFFLQKVPLRKIIQHPNKRKQHLAGRYLLSFLVPDFPVRDILVADSRKPFLKDEKYHFSISHCGDYAAAIVSKNSRVGIDIEIFDQKIIRIQHKFLNDNERAFIGQSEQPSLEYYTTLWCAKEAIYKWYSYGKVNFKENILLAPFSLNAAGQFKGRFIKENIDASLLVKYRLFEKISMTWVTEG